LRTASVTPAVGPARVLRGLERGLLASVQPAPAGADATLPPDTVRPARAEGLGRVPDKAPGLELPVGQEPHADDWAAGRQAAAVPDEQAADEQAADEQAADEQAADE